MRDGDCPHGLNISDAFEAGGGVGDLVGEVEVGQGLAVGEGHWNENVEGSGGGGQRDFEAREAKVVVLFCEARRETEGTLLVAAGLGVVAIEAVDLPGVPVGEVGSEGVEENDEGVQSSLVVGDGSLDSQHGGDL